MKKRFLSIVLLLALILCGCAEKTEKPDPELERELNSAISAVNLENRLSGEYMLEFSFGSNVTFYYAAGDIAWDREKKISNAVFDQTFMGESSKVENYFADEKMVSVDNGETITVDCKSEDILGKFPFCTLDGFDTSFGAITVSENASGKVFSFSRNDTKALCDKVVGTDIYDLVGVLKKPQKEKTEYSDTKCLITVKDGAVASARYEFDIKLFDTPSHVDGYTPPEEEYTIKLHITAKVVYEEFGDKVEIKTKND